MGGGLNQKEKEKREGIDILDVGNMFDGAAGTG